MKLLARCPLNVLKDNLSRRHRLKKKQGNQPQTGERASSEGWGKKRGNRCAAREAWLSPGEQKQVA